LGEASVAAKGLEDLLEGDVLEMLVNSEEE